MITSDNVGNTRKEIFSKDISELDLIDTIDDDEDEGNIFYGSNLGKDLLYDEELEPTTFVNVSLGSDEPSPPENKSDSTSDSTLFP